MLLVDHPVTNATWCPPPPVWISSSVMFRAKALVHSRCAERASETLSHRSVAAIDLAPQGFHPSPVAFGIHTPCPCRTAGPRGDAGRLAVRSPCHEFPQALQSVEIGRAHV